MPYRVKLPPEDEMGQIPDSSLFYPRKSGDSGDRGDGAGVTDSLKGLAVPAPSVCPPLPKGVRLVRYEPKAPPIAIRPVSLVTDVDKFIRHYLREIDARLNSTVQIRGGGSVFEILNKLAEAGLELAIDAPSRDQP